MRTFLIPNEFEPLLLFVGRWRVLLYGLPVVLPRRSELLFFFLIIFGRSFKKHFWIVILSLLHFMAIFSPMYCLLFVLYMC